MNQPIDRLTTAIETGTLTPLQRLRLASLLDVIDVHARGEQPSDMQAAAYWDSVTSWYRRLLEAGEQ